MPRSSVGPNHTNAFRLKRILSDTFLPAVLTKTIENAHRLPRKRIHLITLSRVGKFENRAALS